jgi:ferredoxin-NADP reductase
MTVTDGIGPLPEADPARIPRRLAWQEAEILEVVVETPRAKSLVLRVPFWQGHLPGQHVDVRLTAPDGYQAQRSYSIASAPGAFAEDSITLAPITATPLTATQITLTVERLDDGEVSPFLTDEARVGDMLELRGPIGGYFTWTADAHRPLQLFAGGSGIVPLMAMLRHRARTSPDTPARLLYSARTWETTIYRGELERLAAGDKRLMLAHTLTRETPPDWTGGSRRVDAAMLRELAFPPSADPDMFVCGPTPFVESAATQLVDWGHPAERIKTERFGPTG